MPHELHPYLINIMSSTVLRFLEPILRMATFGSSMSLLFILALWLITDTVELQTAASDYEDPGPCVPQAMQGFTDVCEDPC
jgi:hypothetical protein